MKMFFTPIGVENDYAMTKAAECSFLLLIQRAALLGLKEDEHLNEMQYRQAEDVLLKQYRENLSVMSTKTGRDD